MTATGFSNCFNSGEISDDAQDRTDLQPIAHGCDMALNYLPTIAGPLRKRRGFVRVAAAINQPAGVVRLVPFIKSPDDALMLEFGDLFVRMWMANGAPLMNGGVQVSLVSPYLAADLDNLRYRQVGDVIFFRNGGQPYSLIRNSNTSWSFVNTLLAEGPWLPENSDPTSVVQILSGTQENDVNVDTHTGSILAGTAISLVASKPIFLSGRPYFRFRASAGNPDIKSWQPGEIPAPGEYRLSAGYVYKCVLQGATAKNATTPPTTPSGTQSDGCNAWLYRHDGAGVAQVTGYTDAQHCSAVALTNIPMVNTDTTPYFAEAAYSDQRGFTRMWPAIREERLVEGATPSNPDMLDLSATAGFGPTAVSYSPGLGSGEVVDTDAVRLRIGDDGARLLWAEVTSSLVVGSTSGEYLVSGSVLDQAITPSSVVVKSLSSFGSEDIRPVLAHGSILFVARGSQTLRELYVDPNQLAQGDDLTVLAGHIASRGLTKLAWTRQPDDTLWVRLQDKTLAAFVYHKEQQVRGWARQALGDAAAVEDLKVLPGPDSRDTLWAVILRNNGTQREIWRLSAPSENCFLDCAAFYAGAAVNVIAGLTYMVGKTVSVLANGVEYPGLVVDGAGHVTLPAGVTTTSAVVGLLYLNEFRSLPLDPGHDGARLGNRERAVKALVSLKTAKAQVSMEGRQPQTTVTPVVNPPAPGAYRVRTTVGLASETSRDQRIIITESTAYDGWIYSIKPVLTP